MTWTMLAAAAVFAALSGACGGNARDPGADERRAQDSRSGSRQIAVTGCVAMAPGTSQYVLDNVRMAPLPEQPSDAPTAHGGVITEGAWAKLRVESDEAKLDDHVGRMVTVVGRIHDTGRDTIGTSGQPAAPDEAEKVARDAGPMGRQSMTNGTAPEIIVDRVHPTGKPCSQR